MRKIVLLALLCFALKVQAQQEAMYTQYMFNQLVLNPAYAGIHDAINASMLWREQWVGFEGAPSTQVISAHSPISSRPISMGLTFLRDKIGVTTNHGVNLAYAYRIPITRKMKLSLGLQGNFHNYQTAFNTDALNDPALANGNLNVMKINFGTGAMLHTDKFYLGLGIPRILNQKLDPSNPDSQSELVRHYFLTAGYVFPLSRDLMIKPNLLWKATTGAPSQ
ncbi:MAG: type IX secretion system membrane protein PorP/SprF, partial [Cytophagales bacterium]|nr:type IX secretion system membrane protein PorP/SprF [Cytophagales bacterium]